jgi:hypothetical protein
MKRLIFDYEVKGKCTFVIEAIIFLDKAIKKSVWFPYKVERVGYSHGLGRLRWPTQAIRTTTAPGDPGFNFR